MEPVPYEIREDDIDEVLNSHGKLDGREFSEEERKAAREHVMRQVNDINDTVRTASEDDPRDARQDARRAQEPGAHPGDGAPARRDAALAAIEDLLIRDGYIEPPDERAF